MCSGSPWRNCSSKNVDSGWGSSSGMARVCRTNLPVTEKNGGNAAWQVLAVELQWQRYGFGAGLKVELVIMQFKSNY